MFVGIVRLSVVIGQAHSLKEKRMVLRRIKDRVRERLNVVVNEVGEQDTWQRAELGCAVASADRGKALELLEDVVRVVGAAAESGDAQLVGVARDVVKFEGEATPAVVDERTGAGDKAIAGDDWVPDAWKDEIE